MPTPIWTIAAALVAALAGLALWPLIRTYRTYRGTRVITCPESRAPAAVEVDAALAAASQASTGHPTLRLRSCSRWPERRDCGQGCLAEVWVAPELCLARTLLIRWYSGKRCVLCERPIGDVHWSDHRPALRAPNGATVTWQAIRPEELPHMLSTCAPVCWNCHVAESFRHEHPELVVDDPVARTRA
jgi:hypothetical protein